MASSRSSTSATSSSSTARLRSCLALLEANDVDLLWVSLSECSLTDADVGLLCAALEHNTHALSLDLSSNAITAVGFAALSACLVKGGGQDLIELDLRGNDGLVGGRVGRGAGQRRREEGDGKEGEGEEGEDTDSLFALTMETLRRERRVLNVLVGEVSEAQVQDIHVVDVRGRGTSGGGTSGGGTSGGHTTTGHTTGGHTTSGRSTNHREEKRDAESPAPQYSNIVQNIFQMTEDDESDEESDGESDDGAYVDPAVDCVRLWGEVRFELGCIGQVEYLAIAAIGG